MKHIVELHPKREWETYREKMMTLTKDALASKKAGNFESEKNLWVEASKLQLREQFGVSDLSTIEAVHLRKITEEVMQEQAEQEKKSENLWQKGDEEGARLAYLSTYSDLNREIVARWLLLLYGISQDQIPAGIVDDAFKEYIRRLRENAHKM